MKVKVTLEGQMIKCHKLELVRDITCINCTNLFGLVRLSIHPTPVLPKKKIFYFKFGFIVK